MSDKFTRKIALGIAIAIVLGVTLAGIGGYKIGRTRLRAQMHEAATAVTRLAPASAPAPAPAATERPSAPAVPIPAAAPVSAGTENIKLFLPAILYATPGVELSVFFDNLVDAPDSNALRFTVKCAIGGAERRRWHVTPQGGDEGQHAFEVVVSDLKGQERGRASATLVVPSIKAGKGRSVRVLYVGDSLTHGSWHPAETKRLAARRGYPELSYIGTNSIKENPGIVHEAYSGWTWSCFLQHYEPGSAKTRYRDHSPFLYKSDVDAVPHLDVDRYLRENSPDGPPDLVIFALGINDVYCQDLPFILEKATTLVDAFRKAAPNAALAVWLTQPVNAAQASFDFAYGGKIKRSDIKSRQHVLAQALAKTFGGREREGLFVIPMNLHLDPIDDYPANDAVHPTVPGYNRIGQAMYAWLNYWLDQRAWPAREAEAAVEPKDIP